MFYEVANMKKSQSYIPLGSIVRTQCHMYGGLRHVHAVEVANWDQPLLGNTSGIGQIQKNEAMEARMEGVIEVVVMFGQALMS